MIIKFNLEPWLYALVGYNIFQMMLGVATLIKVLRGSKNIFAIFISFCVIENAIYQITVTLLEAAYIPCYTGSTTDPVVYMRILQLYRPLVYAIAVPFQIHFWLFAVQYLCSAINNFFDSGKQIITKKLYWALILIAEPFIIV